MNTSAYQIKKINDKLEKSNISNHILRRLPEWFGIEESLVEYVQCVKETDFYAYFSSDTPIGFISIKSNNCYTAEIYVIGILKEYQNKGIGKMLMTHAELILKQYEYKLLMVKTLGESHPDKYYKATRQFYTKCGFYPLEEIKEIWGKENPCLIMVKTL